jgi:hypothetical protein
VTCWRYTPLMRRVLFRKIGFISSCVTHSLLIALTHRQYSTVSHLHHLQFIVACALEFFVFTSCLLATDLNTQTATVSLDHTLQILYINQLFCSHVNSSQADLLSSVLLVPIRCLYCCVIAVFTEALPEQVRYNTNGNVDRDTTNVPDLTFCRIVTPCGLI